MYIFTILYYIFTISNNKAYCLFSLPYTTDRNVAYQT